jgi:hypothetical protein
MPYDGGPESYEHLKQQAADVQRRGAKRAAKRAAVGDAGQVPASGQRPAGADQRRAGRPWWMFWRR